MAKHITAQILTHTNFTKGLLLITAQTHRTTAFGNSDDGKSFTASNGIKLVSETRPCRDADKSLPASNTIYLRGSNTAKDSDSIQMSAKRLAKVVKAIEEYNFYYSQAEINKRVRAKREAEAQAAAALAARSCVTVIG